MPRWVGRQRVWRWPVVRGVVALAESLNIGFKALGISVNARLAGGRRWVRTLMWPGMQLQRLTTREPDLDQLAVAVVAMEAVLAVEDPRAAAAEDKVGMEVVA